MLKPREATESSGNAANVPRRQKNLSSQCSGRVALTTEYDNSIPITQKTNPVGGETKKALTQVERWVWVNHRCRSGPLNHEYIQESKL